jgi:hypothetical protein
MGLLGVSKVAGKEEQHILGIGRQWGLDGLLQVVSPPWGGNF